MIPLLHDFSDETVFVVGGGPVGARKARTFAREARTVVVSPEFAERDFGDAELVRAAPAPEEIDGWVDRLDPALVVAATSDEAVNEAVERAARTAGALVNRADRSGGRDVGSVVVPATVRDGSVVAAVATGGAAPALSKALRRRIESEIEGAGPMADLLAEIRADLKAANVDPTDRRDAVRAVVGSSAVWKALQDGLSNARQEANRVMEATDD